MANSFDPMNPEHWSSVMQAFLTKSLVSLEIASTREEASLSN